jgi:hypothetical protein
MLYKEIADVLGRTEKGVAGECKRMGISQQFTEGTTKWRSHNGIARMVIMVSGEWQRLDHHLWKQAGREVPPNRGMVTINGDPRDIRLENLKLADTGRPRNKPVKQRKSQEVALEQPDQSNVTKTKAKRPKPNPSRKIWEGKVIKPLPATFQGQDRIWVREGKIERKIRVSDLHKYPNAQIVKGIMP